MSTVTIQKLFAQDLTFITDTVSTTEISKPYHNLINNKQQKADSLQKSLKHKLDSVPDHFKSQFDSVKTLKFSPGEYTKTLDTTLLSFQRKIVNSLNSSCDSLRLNQVQRLDSVLNITGMQGVSERLDLDDKLNVDTPEVNTAPTLNLPSDNSSVKINIPNVKSGADLNLTDKNSYFSPQKINGFDKIEIDKVNELGDAASQIESISSQTDKLQNGEAAKELGTAIENRALNNDELRNLDDAKKAQAELTTQFESINNLNQNPDSLASLGSTEVIDHFTGKEEMIQKELGNVAKIQTKYKDVSDVRFLPKRPTNSMKGKPFVERLLPGFNFQVFQKEPISIDFGPSLGYRFSGRIVGGLSAFHRYLYTGSRQSISIKTESIYGFRLYSHYKFTKGIQVHMEFQYYKEKPNVIRHSQKLSEYAYAWQPKLNIGFYRDYKLNKRINANFVLLYDALMIREFPNTRGTCTRFGFDYLLKKKKKKNTQPK